MPQDLTRRAFLERTAAVAVASTLPMSTARRVDAQGRMFISLNGAVAPRVPWPETARLAARLGYGGIDFSLPTLQKSGPDAAKALEATKAIFAETKLRPTITNLPFSIQGAQPQYDSGLAALEQGAQFMQDIGSTRMMAVLPTTTTLAVDEFRAMYRERLTAAARVLAKHNIRIGLEFLGPLYFRTRNAEAKPFIYTLPETVKLAAECGPNVGAILDIWHWYHSGGTVAEILAAGKANIVHVHISDAKVMPPEEVRDNMRLMPGEGAVDVSAFLQALQKIGYDGGVAPEPLGRIPMDMSGEEAAKLGYDTTFAALKKAGVA